MALYADLQAQHYLDSTYGVVSNQPNTGCDNYHLYSSEAMLLANWGLWPQYASFFKACEVEPGLIKRYPGREGAGISQDEMFGAATLDENAAKRIYDYGNKHWWYFNPDKTPFTLDNWFGRFLDFKPYVKMRTGARLNLIDKFLWAIMTVLSPLSSYGNTSGKLLKWTQLHYMQGNNWLCDVAIKWWRYRITKMYPGGMQEIMGIYFGPAHPFTLNARKDFK